MRVVLVEDDGLTRASLTEALAAVPGIVVAGVHRSAEDALGWMQAEGREDAVGIDVMVVTWSCPGSRASTWWNVWRENFPGCAS